MPSVRKYPGVMDVNVQMTGLAVSRPSGVKDLRLMPPVSGTCEVRATSRTSGIARTRKTVATDGAPPRMPRHIHGESDPLRCERRRRDKSDIERAGPLQRAKRREPRPPRAGITQTVICTTTSARWMQVREDSVRTAKPDRAGRRHRAGRRMQEARNLERQAGQRREERAYRRIPGRPG